MKMVCLFKVQRRVNPVGSLASAKVIEHNLYFLWKNWEDTYDLR